MLKWFGKHWQRKKISTFNHHLEISPIGTVSIFLMLHLSTQSQVVILRLTFHLKHWISTQRANLSIKTIYNQKIFQSAFRPQAGSRQRIRWITCIAHKEITSREPLNLISTMTITFVNSSKRRSQNAIEHNKAEAAQPLMKRRSTRSLKLWSTKPCLKELLSTRSSATIRMSHRLRLNM